MESSSSVQALAEQQRLELDAERERRALVGYVAPMSSLAKEYEDASQTFKGKVAYLCGTYRGIHYIRGDGNCFVRGAGVFGLLNFLRVAEPLRRDAVVDVLKGSSQRMINAGYSGSFLLEAYISFFGPVFLPLTGPPLKSLLSRTFTTPLWTR